MLKVLVCSIQLILLTPIANERSVEAEIRDFGLLGTWARECDQAPTPGNEHTTFSVTRAAVQVANDFGRERYDMIYRIVAAKPISPDRLALRQALTSDDRIVLDVVVLKSGDKIRTWSSRMVDGTDLVRDGVVASAGGHETNWAIHCLGQRADRGSSTSGSL